MPFAFLLRAFNRQPQREARLRTPLRDVPIRFVWNRRARRYILRVQADGTARVTVPRGGSRSGAMEFAQRQAGWVERQLQNPQRTLQAQPWRLGTEILYRGLPVRLAGQEGELRFADQCLQVESEADDLRPHLEKHLSRLSAKELTARTFELAAVHQLAVRRVTVRNQRSRWGSCSAKRTISLNWRLVQTPERVRDYIILHELMHLKEMNHSPRFWNLVQEVCPDYAEAEAWLKRHADLLR